jgi:putative PIN family toxin of toxin-antitoxin system
MKVILDTNVIVSGIFWKGASEKVLYAWADDKFKLVISSEIIKEIIKTLMNFKIKLPFDEILLWLSIFLWKAELVEPEERVDVVKDDPDDNKFIEAAIVENADYI